MRPLSSGHLAGWVLMLGLLAGCDALKSAVPSSESPRSAPSSGKVAPAGSPWARARVGDRLTYAFSGYRSSRFDGNGGLGIPKSGRLVLEVVAVRHREQWPPGASHSRGAQRDPLRLNGRVVPSIAREHPSEEGEVLSTHHAADLWDSALEGLAWEARVLPLRKTGKAGPDMAHREPTLMGWGTWLDPKVRQGVK